MTTFIIVALDGPGGVGKSTAGKALADRLGCYFLSSGRIYRALAWLALGRGWNVSAALPQGLVEDAELQITGDGELTINGAHPGDVLSSPEIAHATSILSAQPAVRELSNQVQRSTVEGIKRNGHYSGVVLEGRDIGTVVFPEAEHKIFLTARLEVRAQRRYHELEADDPSITLEAVTEALQERDARDSQRELAPLKAAADALVIDTSALNLEQVVQAMSAAIEGRQ